MRGGDEINQRLSVWEIGVDGVGRKSEQDENGRPAVRDCSSADKHSTAGDSSTTEANICTEKNEKDRELLEAQKHTPKHLIINLLSHPSLHALTPPHLGITRSHICDNATAA
ncbi:hypothetical protein PBY51_000709 [Eleginops maclovinus]|uniref:Uncharacterized protein n=1 Tax=Eleginops maclovinus TaxID=56733 RepID=A0AAN8AKV1_ELEMC|nr:hypothetical protein PBY51_000709 [Eleginops maclovinus]